MAKDRWHQHEKRKPVANVRWEYDRHAFPYIPRKKPLPPPASGGTDAPTIWIEVNEYWLSHVLGALSVLLELDSWEGTDQEREDAVREVNRILETMTDDPCG